MSWEPFFARPMRPATPSSLALGGCPGPAPPPRMDRGDTGRILEEVASFGVEIKPRLTNGHKRAAVAVGSVTTAELSFDRYTCV
jgi:hypothetical protein